MLWPPHGQRPRHTVAPMSAPAHASMPPSPPPPPGTAVATPCPRPRAQLARAPRTRPRPPRPPIRWRMPAPVGQSHLNSLSRHNGPRWIGMMRLIRPNISQLAHMNPQLQFYVEQQRDSRDVTVARRPAFRPLDAQIIMRLPCDRGRLVGRPALGNGIVGLAAMNARRQAVLIMTSRQRARGMGGMIMEQAPFSQ